MAERILIYREEDVCGAKLKEKSIKKNSEDDLRRWIIACRGLSSTKTEMHEALVRRVKEIKVHGLDKFVFNSDKDTSLRILQDHVKGLPVVELPKLENWTESMDVIPLKYSYTAIVEYLIKRQIRLVHVSGIEQDSHVVLPIADKPLVKGYNFFASGQVGEILLNPTQNAVHVCTTVLASMRDCRYDVKCVIDKQTGLIIQGECKCPAGAAGKCNHIAGLLFALLNYIMVMQNPDCCTNRAQVWHAPQRKSKKSTQCMVVGRRKVVKHTFGKKRTLMDYAISDLYEPDPHVLLEDLRKLKATKHNIALLQVLESSSEESNLEDEVDQNVENQKRLY